MKKGRTLIFTLRHAVRRIGIYILKSSDDDEASFPA
jgi:hypothetical protein